MIPGFELLQNKRYSHNTTTVSLVRQEPASQSIWYRPRKTAKPTNKNDVRRYHLSMPWRYYVISRYDYTKTAEIMKVAMSAQPKLDGKGLSLPCLPNTFRTGMPCGTFSVHFTNLDAELEDFLIPLYNKFWDSVFNTDITPKSHPVWHELAKQANVTTAARISILNRWEKLSQDQVLELPWPDDKTVLI